MAMARSYSRAKHQPAALIYSRCGTLRLLVLAPPLGVFAGYHLPRAVDEILSAHWSPDHPMHDQMPTDPVTQAADHPAD
jgi:hypothetical protein